MCGRFYIYCGSWAVLVLFFAPMCNFWVWIWCQTSERASGLHSVQKSLTLTPFPLPLDDNWITKPRKPRTGLNFILSIRGVAILQIFVLWFLGETLKPVSFDLGFRTVTPLLKNDYSIFEPAVALMPHTIMFCIKCYFDSKMSMKNDFTEIMFILSTLRG